MICDEIKSNHFQLYFLGLEKMEETVDPFEFGKGFHMAFLGNTVRLGSKSVGAADMVETCWYG